MDSAFGNQVLLNAIIVAALQWLKNSKWFPWLSAETEKANRIIAVLLAGAAALGVHTNFDHTTGVLTITGLTLATIWSGLYNWLVSFVTQQTLFKVTVSQAPTYALGVAGQPLQTAAQVKGETVATPVQK